MKRIFALFLALSMTFLLFGCTAETPEPKADTPQTQPATEGPKLITNIDDFLAAIAPGAEIFLGEGAFNLGSASNYGSEGSDCYHWSDLGGGEYGLVIHDLKGLTIRGSGKGKTTLLTDPRYADVIWFQNCENLSVKDLTLGHTQMTSPCEAGVLRLERCVNTRLEGLGLFGCGSIGVYSWGCQDLTVQSCEIYDCSTSAVSMSDTKNAAITSCDIHTLGKEQPASAVFQIWSGCADVTVSNCMVSSNYVQNLIEAIPEYDTILFRDNQFSDNALAQAAFFLQGGSVVLENNVFESNKLRTWYAFGSDRAVDLEGNELTFESAEIEEIVPGEAQAVSTGEQKEVRVKTADEFIAALASDTRIVLDTDFLDLSTAQGYQAAMQKHTDSMELLPDAANPNVGWEDNYDGPSLVISGLSNLTIQSAGGDRKSCTISATPRYAYVLTFENCAAITLSGFTAGHTIEPGYCMGGVVAFRNSENLLVDNCGLYGCGTVGVNADFCRELQVVNSEIYECSLRGIDLGNCDTVSISGTLIRDIGDEYGPGYFFSFRDSQNVTLNGEPIDGNYHGN